MGTEDAGGNRVSVAVVDDDADARLYFSDLLQATNGFRHCGCFSNGNQALSGVPLLNPDLVLMDIRMPDLDGIECTRRLKQAIPRLKIIMVTAVRDTHSMDECVKAGAEYYLVKPFTADQCVAALKFAASGRVRPNEAPLEPNPTASARLPKDYPQLTPRDTEVIQLMDQGFLYKEIGHRLGMSYSAVHKHQHRIFQKLRVTNRTEAIRTWLHLQR